MGIQRSTMRAGPVKARVDLPGIRLRTRSGLIAVMKIVTAPLAPGTTARLGSYA